MSHKVELAIYDLSMGMARGLSAQILGPDYALDMIPHSAVLVYGKEYYFGGGIQSDDPYVFRRSHGNIQPQEILVIGYTSKSKYEFDNWCRQNTTRFNANTYNLMSHNCNNFAHEALTLGLGLAQGVPQRVLDVPNIVRSSPMGQMMLPMLEGMQMQGNAMDPFANNSSYNTPSSVPSTQGQASTSSAAAINDNPWAHIPSASETKVAMNTTTESTKAFNNNDASAISTKQTTIIDKHDKYILPGKIDVNSVKNSVEKLQLNLCEAAPSDQIKQIKSSLDSLRDIFLLKKDASHLLTDKHLSALYFFLEKDVPNVHSLVLFRNVLLLIRKNTTSMQIQSAFVRCLSIIASKLTLSLFTNPAVKGMAWMTLSSGFAFPSIFFEMISSNNTSFDNIIEAALRDLVEASDRKDLRQCISIFLFNASLYYHQKHSSGQKSSELPDVVVTLICGVLESIEEETCENTAFYRLLVPALFTKPTDQLSDMCSNLLLDLGYDEMLNSVIEKFKSGGNQAHLLASEIISVISS